MHLGHIRSYHFVFDGTEDRRTLKFLTVDDELSRISLAIALSRGFIFRRVIHELLLRTAQRGAPQFIRSDNGQRIHR